MLQPPDPPKITKKYAKGVNTRNAIIETCRDLFWDKGYNATTYKDILRLVGTHPKAVTHHLGNKKNIATIIYAEFMKDFYQAVDDLLPEADDTQRVLTLMTLFYQAVLDYANLRRFYAEYSAVGALDGPSDYNAIFNKSYEVIVDTVGRAEANLHMSLCRGLDSAVGAHLMARGHELTIKDLIKVLVWHYCYFLPNEELQERLNISLKVTAQFHAVVDRFTIAIKPVSDLPLNPPTNP
ncbi:MAG: TetR/AcrR family transcriptional regulator [Deltaproteobacteria bacterium]|jgi:AcrR family transcriptional regulator|nr:TetR/AcrR family transcriptional regulator [Deltaproteobacteria bacterium]